MRKSKVIAIVGVSDEATAHLRLIMRKAAPELTFAWRWGQEGSADLIVVEPTVFAGQMARNRAQSSGVRCAILCEQDYPETDGLILRQPLKQQNVIDVLNQATTATVGQLDVAAHGADFYFQELEDFVSDPDAESPMPDAPDRWNSWAPNESVAPGLDELIHGDPLAEPATEKKKPLLGRDTALEATGEPTQRSEKRGDKAYALHIGAPTQDDPDAAPSVKRAASTDGIVHPLQAYLTGKILGGPSLLSLAGAPSLAVDPKHQIFFVEGSLAALEVYCRDPLPRSAWRNLTSSELAQVRAEIKPRPYSHLRWLEVLLHAGGRLASHLDPGGSYRLTQRVEVEADYRGHDRIAAALQEKARLHEIAATSGESMEAVFDLVTAYDAIGAIEWQPRQRRHADPVPEVKPKPGLIGKLGWPFGKR